MANMKKSKLKNFMAADDRGMNRGTTKKGPRVTDSVSPALTMLPNRMIFSPTLPEAGP